MDDELLDEARETLNRSGIFRGARRSRRYDRILNQRFRPVLSSVEFLQYIHELGYVPRSCGVLPHRRNLGHYQFDFLGPRPHLRERQASPRRPFRFRSFPLTDFVLELFLVFQYHRQIRFDKLRRTHVRRRFRRWTGPRRFFILRGGSGFRFLEAQAVRRFVRNRRLPSRFLQRSDGSFPLSRRLRKGELVHSFGMSRPQ